MSEPEAKTRKKRIDKKLRSLNPSWEIIPYKDGFNTEILERHAIEEYMQRRFV